MLVQSDDEVDIDAQVEAAKQLLATINKNNRSQEEAAQTTGMPPQSSYNKSNEQASEMALTRGGEDPFIRPDPYDKPVDRSKGKSMAFKALSRSEVNKVKSS